jgi:hypothetical protein
MIANLACKDIVVATSLLEVKPKDTNEKIEACQNPRVAQDSFYGEAGSRVLTIQRVWQHRPDGLVVLDATKVRTTKLCVATRVPNLVVRKRSTRKHSSYHDLIHLQQQID